MDGQWSPAFPLPLIAIHGAGLPTGDVLLFSSDHGVPGIHAWVLDPVSLALTEVPPPPPWDPDCAGHSFLADGRLLVSGGRLTASPLTGTPVAYLFDASTSSWNRLPDMAAGRWYPTNVTLPDGRVLSMAGLSDVANVQNPDVEIYDPQQPAAWSLSGQKLLPYYPSLHVMPDGRVFRSGPDPSTESYDPLSDTWTPVATTNFPGRYEAPSVLLPRSTERVMLIGGYAGSGAPTSSCEVIDLSEAAPAWSNTPPMQFARMEHDAVLLPDGKVLVVGGRSNGASPVVPVMVPEVFDPRSSTWDALAPHAVPRAYHSIALLLPDARVLVAGSDHSPSGEIFSPPYLFNGPRPVITAAPPTIVYGTPFDVTFSSNRTDNEVVLVRLSSVTHSNNMGQRYVLLGNVTTGSGSYTIPAPANANLAPPGYYMLFVVDESGVPSVSRIVRVSEPFPDCNGNGVPDDEDLSSGNSTDFDGNGVPDECDPLSADTAALSVLAGGAQTFTLNAGTANAGDLYMLLGSSRGSSPGLFFGGLTIPLNYGGYFLDTLNRPNQAPLAGSLGSLDGNGKATASFTLPPGSPASLVGVTLYHAYGVFRVGPFRLLAASNAVPVTFAP